MYKFLTLFLLLSIAVPSQAQGVNKTVLNDLIFKRPAELTSKYGKPVIKKSNDSNADSLDILLESSSVEWLVNGKKIIVEYSDVNLTKPKKVLIIDFVLGNDFYKIFGWDKPLLTTEGKYIIISGLKGLTGEYNKEGKYIVLSLENPNISTFGKKK